MRILNGNGGRWLIGAGRVAFVPEHVVADEAIWNGAQQAFQAAAAPRPAAKPPYSLTVLTSTSCNLACPYCFQNTARPDDGSAVSPRIAAESITAEVVQRIRRFVDRQVDAGGHSGVSLQLFGGEPLLMHDMCVLLLRSLQSVPLSMARVQTNGTLLSRNRALVLEAEGLRDIHVTFDGHAVQHDSLRYNRGGRGTYRLILRRIAEVSEVTSVRWTIRVNVNHQNLDSMQAVVADLRDHVPADRCQVYFAFLRDFGFGVSNTLEESDAVVEAFIGAQRSLLENGFAVSVPGDDVACPYCGEVGGTTGAVVGPTGNLYSCWESAGRPEYVVGTIDDGYIGGPELEARWFACEFGAQDQWLEDVRTRISESVDAYTLDWLRANGGLGKRVDQPARTAAASLLPEPVERR